MGQCQSSDCSELSPYNWVNQSAADGDVVVTVSREYNFRATHNTWMYVVISNCNPGCSGEGDGHRCHSPVDVTYNFDFRNNYPFKGNDSAHFSADEEGIWDITLAFFVLQCFNLLLMYIVRRSLVSRRKYHKTVQILGAVVFMHWLSLLFSLIHYSAYMEDGEGIISIWRASRYIDILCETTFIALLILLAKGWTIVRRKISPLGRIKIAIFSTIYACVGSLAFIIHGWMTYDVATVTYFYESEPGKSKFVLFCSCSFFKRAKEEKEKENSRVNKVKRHN